jgi:PIN domain nuclease of toxin-antitoxin system
VIVLDTHAWIWWVADREQLSRAARDAIEASDEIGISAISAWEVTMLVERGRLELDRPVQRWVRQAVDADGRFVEIPLSTSIALRAAGLGRDGMHRDPADRFILASAHDRDARLVTKDRAIRAFAPDRTTW